MSFIWDWKVRRKEGKKLEKKEGGKEGKKVEDQEVGKIATTSLKMFLLEDYCLL